ncbi:MAG: helix-turn-helix transcriptional regulator [Phycisphaerae bacterium]|nr:helix-turn-helix transcriptional regulator [Phycisphaerae bacterium]
MAKKRPKFSDQIRELVETSGYTRAEISRQTDIDQATLSRFVNRERGLPMNTLDVLADFLGLEVVRKGKGW